jgi:5-(aminomethyl)-3-furanmethanol phosphate kinase
MTLQPNHGPTGIPLRCEATPQVRVLKLGGSLLDAPNLRERFDQMLAEIAPKLNLVIVGGGEWVEEVRRLDRIHGLEPAWVHELCIDLMQHTAALAQQILNVGPLVTQSCELDDLVRTSTERISCDEAVVVAGASIVAPTAYRSTIRGLLPHSWEVTSDSIAACLAQSLGGCELILLKSADGPDVDGAPQGKFSAWSAQGLVDPYFAKAARGLTDVSISNLRNWPAHRQGSV